MDIEVSIALEEALDLAWRTLAECFRPEQLLMRQELIDKYLPEDVEMAGGDADAEAAMSDPTQIREAS
jgi:V/A-type H+-transporting ATPase subunit B